ncbi:MAG TPA: LysR substrate-binding domain-containing protein [Bryobacteraceae bacterium]|nr:LysR substrate-binding domain-containing protein [Bryobacteraceae bacterium]
MPQLENFRLRVFRAVAEQLSFRKAAEQLFLTQPAVTLQIKALEDDLGVRLFDRAGGRVAMTKQGSLLLRYAREIATLASDALREIAAAEDQLSGSLSLGVSTTIAQYVLPRLMAAFLAENPRIRLSLHSGNTGRIVQLLLEEKVAIGIIEGPAREPGVRTEDFMRDELVLITPPGFECDRLSRDRLKASNLLLREHGSGTRAVVESALDKAGVRLRSFKNVIELDSTEAIKSAVEAGLGIAFVSRWALLKELELGLLKMCEVSGVKVVRHFSLISRTGPGLQGLAASFRSFARDRIRLLSDAALKPRRSEPRADKIR